LIAVQNMETLGFFESVAQLMKLGHVLPCSELIGNSGLQPGKMSSAVLDIGLRTSEHSTHSD
jgi:hypothetical protein